MLIIIDENDLATTRKELLHRARGIVTYNSETKQHSVYKWRYTADSPEELSKYPLDQLVKKSMGID